MSEQKSINRRNFLRKSALGVLGAGIINSSSDLAGANRPNQLNEAKEPDGETTALPKIKEYRTLGRTGFKVSDIASGGGSNEAVFNALLDAGVNYIDTAESYNRGLSEIAAGKAIKNRDRKSVFITTKLELEGDLGKETFLKRARKCLERLDTEYIDCLMIHCPTKIEEIKTEGFHAAAQQLKSEGKLRFVGLSNHGTQWSEAEDNMENVCLAAAADGRFDVMLFAYNFIQREPGERIIKACREKNIGTTLMKTNPVGTYSLLKGHMETLQKEGKPIPEFYTQTLPTLKARSEKADQFIREYHLQNEAEIKAAAIKYVLSNPGVHAVCCSVRNFDDVESFVKLSGCALTGAEEKKLSAYEEGCGAFYCRHACGICQSLCPEKVPINTIMRYNHYFTAQGREKHALQKYAALPGAKADRCFSCTGLCQAGCPYGVPIHGLLTIAHQQLTLA